jgi:hypothetical protein
MAADEAVRRSMEALSSAINDMSSAELERWRQAVCDLICLLVKHVTASVPLLVRGHVLTTLTALVNVATKDTTVLAACDALSTIVSCVFNSAASATAPPAPPAPSDPDAGSDDEDAAADAAEAAASAVRTRSYLLNESLMVQVQELDATDRAELAAIATGTLVADLLHTEVAVVVSKRMPRLRQLAAIRSCASLFELLSARMPVEIHNSGGTRALLAALAAHTDASAAATPLARARVMRRGRPSELLQRQSSRQFLVRVDSALGVGEAPVSPADSDDGAALLRAVLQAVGRICDVVPDAKDLASQYVEAVARCVSHTDEAVAVSACSLLRSAVVGSPAVARQLAELGGTFFCSWWCIAY